MVNILKKVLRVIVRSCIFLYCKIIYRIKIIGKENIPKEGALLFCGNHRNYLDPQLIVCTSGRHMSFMAKEELKKNPFFAFLGYVFDVIYVKRDEKDISALKEALKTLKSGNCIGIFPEGTRNGFEKNEGEIKNGTAYMALKTGAKIIPIGIVGTAKPFSATEYLHSPMIMFLPIESIPSISTSPHIGPQYLPSLSNRKLQRAMDENAHIFSLHKSS